VLTPQLTLKASDRKPPALGPKVRVELAHLSPAGDDAALAVLLNGDGLSDWDKDGLLEHDTAAKNMWRGACSTNLSLEFELPEPVALGTIEVWNYNAEWQTKDGVRKADVAVSPDGTTWQTVLRGAEFAEAEGNRDYDEPIQLKLNGVTARKVRFENIVPWNDKGQVGLSKVVFHQAIGAQAGNGSAGN
jgi:F5/8 type C domain